MRKITYIFALIVLTATCIIAQENPSVSYNGVVWSPDGQYLSFDIMEFKGSGMSADIHIMKADGTGIKKLDTGEGAAVSPSWSNDGKRLFFQILKMTTRESDIYSISTDGTGLTRLTKDSGRNGAPSVSPDGKRIAYTSNKQGGKSQIYVMNVDGSNQKALTTNDSVALFNPVWSPDSKKIVYYAEKGDSKDQIWVMKADGSNQTLLTNNIGHNYFPSWSPNGKKIVFASKREGVATIYTMNADGSDVKRLADITSGYARYSPDGKKLALVVSPPPIAGAAGQRPMGRIYLANADGSGITKLEEK